MAEQVDSGFDGVFMSTLDRCKGVEIFFDRLFGFFKRKTDLFDDEAYALGIVDQYLKKNLEEYKFGKKRQEPATGTTATPKSAQLESANVLSKEVVARIDPNIQGKQVITEEVKDCRAK